MKLNFGHFFSDIANFLRGGRVLGVDIGTASVKAVELSKKGDRFYLQNYGEIETRAYLNHFSFALQAGSLKIAIQEAVRLLKIILREMKPKTKTALFSLPSFGVFITPIEMPLMDGQETEKAVLFQARHIIPIPIEQVSLDWTKIAEYQSERGPWQQRVLLIGIPNDLLDAYKEIARQTGLRLVFLELESLALVRSLLREDNQIVLVADIGALAMGIFVVQNGVLQYTTSRDKAGFYLTQALVRSLDLGASRAEEIKRKRGIMGTSEIELSTLLLSFLDVIIEEIRAVRDLYERRYGAKVEKIVLSGGGANMLGIDKYVSQKMGLQVYHPMLFRDIVYPKELELFVKSLGNELAVAVGIAKSYFL